MEQFYYRCKQILEEVLKTQGFTTQAETIALGRSIIFTKEDLDVLWGYDLRDQMLYLGMRKNKKSVGSTNFYSTEQLRQGFLTKLDEMLKGQGLTIPEQNRQLASNDIASFQTEKTRKGFFDGLFGKKSK